MPMVEQDFDREKHAYREMTVALGGLWEQLLNPDFKLVEFDQIKNEAGINALAW